MPFFLVNRHAAEVRPYAQGELCCLARHHFRTCPTPAPAVTDELIRNVFVRPLFVSDGRRPCGSQVLRLVSLTACRRPYSGSPTAACSHCLTIDDGLRPSRRGSACIPVKPGLSLVPDSPSNTYRGLTFTELQRSLNTTACGFGRPHGLGRTASSKSPRSCDVGTRMHTALQGNRVGASSAALLPPRRALYLFSQVGYC